MTAYVWHNAARVKADPQMAGQMCEELEQTVGLTAETLLDANRPEDAPLHNEFEWDDSIAAEEYRKDQARHIIMCLRVAPEEKTVEPVRAFFPLGTPIYESVQHIFSVPEKKEALMQRALKELDSFKRKYAALECFKSLFDVIDNISVSNSKKERIETSMPYIPMVHEQARTEQIANGIRG